MRQCLSDFDYQLPSHLIALEQVKPRDSARLLVLDRTSKKIMHKKVSDLPNLLPSPACLVTNNSRVLQSRFYGFKVPSGGGVECLIFDGYSSQTMEYRCLLRSGSKLKVGQHFELQDRTKPKPIQAVIIKTPESDLFQRTGSLPTRDDFFVIQTDESLDLEKGGVPPIPPYIEKARSEAHSRSKIDYIQDDEKTYQTVYSKNLGSIACPTAGLHFTEELLSQIKAHNISIQEITLHVGLGTFQTPKEEEIEKIKLHQEHFEITEAVAHQVEKSKKAKAPVIAVGTTTLRALESAFQVHTKTIRTGPQNTALFLYPGHGSIQVVDHLMTNFHLPRSTLLMLVCAFAGRDLIFRAYQEAIQEGYRFFSFGDAMLIL